MPETKDNRTKLITLRLTLVEYEQLNSRFKTTTCRKFSDYLRKVLLTGKVIVLTRNQSLDDFMTEMIELRNELSAIGSNFNQAVRKLHTLQQITEFKTWIITNELQRKILFNKIDEIKKRINQFAERW
jgi:hypothetical protein